MNSKIKATPLKNIRHHPLWRMSQRECFANLSQWQNALQTWIIQDSFCSKSLRCCTTRKCTKSHFCLFSVSYEYKIQKYNSAIPSRMKNKKHCILPCSWYSEEILAKIKLLKYFKFIKNIWYVLNYLKNKINKCKNNNTNNKIQLHF